MSDPVELTDLDIITRYSIAVRSATAERDELIETLRADLSWLEAGRMPSRNAPIEPTWVARPGEAWVEHAAQTPVAAPAEPSPPDLAPEPDRSAAPIRRMSGPQPRRTPPPATGRAAKKPSATAAGKKAAASRSSSARGTAKQNGSKQAASSRAASSRAASSRATTRATTTKTAAKTAAKTTARRTPSRSAGSSTARGTGRGRRR